MFKTWWVCGIFYLYIVTNAKWWRGVISSQTSLGRDEYRCCYLWLVRDYQTIEKFLELFKQFQSHQIWSTNCTINRGKFWSHVFCQNKTIDIGGFIFNWNIYFQVILILFLVCIVKNCSIGFCVKFKIRLKPHKCYQTSSFPDFV